MTTIAYKNGIIACDKQGTWYNQASKAPFKAIVTEDVVYLITGVLATGLRFIEYLQGGQEGKPPKIKDTTIYEFDRNTGKLNVWESRHISFPIVDKIWADGSGGQFAIGAMAMGATPEQAVRIAIKYDV